MEEKEVCSAVVKAAAAIAKRRGWFAAEPAP
jgi:hypothetical protein